MLALKLSIGYNTSDHGRRKHNGDHSKIIGLFFVRKFVKKRSRVMLPEYQKNSLNVNPEEPPKDISKLIPFYWV